MTSSRNVSRTVGVLVLVHLATGLIVPYAFLQALSLPPGFLETAAGMPYRIRLNVLALFVGGAIPVGIAVSLWPVARRFGHALGLWLLTLATVNLSLQMVENGHWLSLLSLSEAYAKAGPANAALFQSLGGVVQAAWRWAHYAHIFTVVAWLFTLYALLYRYALVPRVLAAAGLATAALHFVGITLPVFLNYRVPLPALFGIPLGLANVALAVWLLSKGFREST
jgi:hypothetical protein